MREVEIQTAEPVYTRGYTEKLVKILNRNYATVDFEQVTANTTQLNTEEITQVLSLLNLNFFEELFYVTLGDWDIEPADLELKLYFKPFNFKYHPVPRINK